MSQARSFTSVQPAGTISHFANSNTPTGWLKCDGSAISRTAYSDLFTAIGTTYGTGDGSTTFNVPDLRGEFVRGYDDGRGVDSGRIFAASQSDAMRNITGYLPTGTNGGAYLGAFYKGTSFAGNGGDPQTNYRAMFDASRVVPTSTEYVPRNISLLICIKY